MLAGVGVLNGLVVMTAINQRIEAGLAVSRAIGDRSLKPFVTARPDVRSWTLGPNDRWLVLASDGVFDVLSNREVGELAASAQGAQAAAEVLVETALMRGSTDNVTALVVDLAKARK